MSARRGDIDGLRAIAIAAVLVFHAFPRALPGGYAGVDVFFVVSGYLISRIILADAFSFAGFYARRLRRIVPALAIVLAACLVAGWFVLLPDEYAALGVHVAGGAGFVANFVLWREVGYFDTAAATKPLLHLWSLGIEEQFYLLWPLLLWLCRRRARALTAIAFAASFGAAIATPAFYAPWTRLWELLVGAMLAQLAPRTDVRLALAGLAAIAAGIALRLDGALMIVPTLGTALVIFAGEATAVGRALAHPVLTWLGRISFPLYLWHWPLLVFAGLLGHASTPARWLALIASVALADLTYRVVERPIQRGPTRPAHVVGLVGALLAVGLAGLAIDAGRGYPDRPSATRAPDFLAFAFASSEGCTQAHPYARGTCWASPRRHAKLTVMIGDSHGDALGAGLMRAPLGTDLLMITRVGCLPFRGVEWVLADGTLAYHCREVIDAAYAEVLADPRVDTVVLAARHALRVNLSGFGEPDQVGDLGHTELPDGTRDPVEVYRRALVDTLAPLVQRGIRVVFVDQAPELGFDPHTCVARLTGDRVGSCSLPRAEVEARQQRYRAIVDQVLASFPQVVRVDPLPLFCTADACSAWRDGEMMYHDDDHLSPRGAEVLAAEIVRKLARRE